ncbi:MAG: beta galactosidase jelly roll domain-containing protein, partial [Clostridia bacterium]|nr:beta galactosidase jelly roll domain-containing protein [Clostridia bacterium]
MNIISLNGTWMLDYLGSEPYLETEEPRLTAPRPGTPADAVPCPVPSYFEDLSDLFRTTPLHTRLAYNPLYTLQRYPQAGYVPDMALPNPVGCFIYQRGFVLSAVQENAELVIGGVQNAAAAWLNGHYLGRHEGYSSAFSFAIPAGVLTEGENRLTLAVSNTRLAGYAGRPISGLTSRAACECTGGIYGDVSLCFYPDGLRDVWVTTAEDATAFTVHTEGGDGCERTVTVYDEKRCVATATIPCGESAATLSAEGFTLWSPATPKLYTVKVTAKSTEITHRFGIRRLVSRGNRLYLNGRPYYFRGICEHCYHPLTVHPTRDKGYYRRVLRTLRELGFNSIRFHTYIPMPEYMEAADEIGILMELETPNNTTAAEWRDIVRMARHYTAPVAYSSGNEMVIDEDYIAHLAECAAVVHENTDSLFSPMSAMRGVEYHSFGAGRIDTPFTHDPVRLAALSEFCDLYNTYSLGATSYHSDSATAAILDKRNSVYDKPLLSHEICIGGTYIDLTLAERYHGTRIGDTELFSSVKRHLADKGLLDRAPLYYRHSVAWQKLLRKDCFELCRRADTLAGYDFLGDIDTHWHTFGYCVGMMNEFYELKPGETVENVRRYNSDTVLLCDLPRSRNLLSGEKITLPILLSHYGEDIKKATLTLRLSDGARV